MLLVLGSEQNGFEVYLNWKHTPAEKRIAHRKDIPRHTGRIASGARWGDIGHHCQGGAL